MERLTEKTIGCFEYTLKNHAPVVGEFRTYDAFFDYSMAVRMLGKYEDTNQTPDYIEDLKAELAQVKAERDAAIEEIPHNCEHCLHAGKNGKCGLIPDGDEFSPDYTEGFDRDDCERWEWRGLEANR